MRLYIPIVVLLLTGLGGCALFDPSEESTPPLPPVETWTSLHYRNVVRQQTDFSCGAASLSTISNYYWGRTIGEKQFTEAIRANYSKEQWQEKEKDGLSLLDMKVVAEKFGLKAEGLKMTIDDAMTLNGPIILHLDKGYAKHFSVLRSIEGDRAYLSDPIIGNVRLPLWRLAEHWTGYALAVWVEDQPLPSDHPLVVKSTDATNEAVAARRFLYARPVPTISGRF